LYAYFGWQAPQFAHLPLLLNPDKSKLSKRQGDVAVSDFTNKGYLADALINFVAFLGWNPGTPKELYSIDELVADFNLEKVSKAGAVFNQEKLNWYNKEYIKKLTSDELLDRAMPWLEQAKIIKSADTNPEHHNEAWLQKVVLLERERITTLADIAEAVKFMFDLPEYQKELLVWRKGTLEEVQKILPELKSFLESVPESEWVKATLESKVGEWIKQKEYSTGSVLWPLRVSLSGQQNSPGPYEIAEVLGREETLKRLASAVSKL
jgi:glutamyl/glutaminyl-tRNA synthetase